MLEFVEEGGADVIVVQFLDRFGRNPREILQRFWTEHEVNGESNGKVFKRAVMLPKPVQKPAPTLL